MRCFKNKIISNLVLVAFFFTSVFPVQAFAGEHHIFPEVTFEGERWDTFDEGDARAVGEDQGPYYGEQAREAGVEAADAETVSTVGRERREEQEEQGSEGGGQIVGINDYDTEEPEEDEYEENIPATLTPTRRQPVKPAKDTPAPSDRNQGDPVSLYTGEFIYGATDLFVPGRGLNFLWSRTYRSQVKYWGALGHNWTHNHNKSIREYSDKVVHTGPTGHILTFKKENGAYVSPKGSNVVLERVAKRIYPERNEENIAHNVRTVITGAENVYEVGQGNQIVLRYTATQILSHDLANSHLTLECEGIPDWMLSYYTSPFNPATVALYSADPIPEEACGPHHISCCAENVEGKQKCGDIYFAVTRSGSNQGRHCPFGFYFDEEVSFDQRWEDVRAWTEPTEISWKVEYPNGIVEIYKDTRSSSRIAIPRNSVKNYFIASTTDREGNALKYRYRNGSKLITIEDSLGREVIIDYHEDPQNHFIKSVRMGEKLVEYTYDENDDLVKSCITPTDEYPEGTCEHYRYDSEHYSTEARAMGRRYPDLVGNSELDQSCENLCESTTCDKFCFGSGVGRDWGICGDTKENCLDNHCADACSFSCESRCEGDCGDSCSEWSGSVDWDEHIDSSCDASASDVCNRDDHQGSFASECSSADEENCPDSGGCGSAESEGECVGEKTAACEEQARGVCIDASLSAQELETEGYSGCMDGCQGITGENTGSDSCISACSNGRSICRRGCIGWCDLEFEKCNESCNSPSDPNSCTSHCRESCYQENVRYGVAGDLNHNLIKVLDHEEKLFLQNWYEDDTRSIAFDRVVRQRNGHIAQLMEFNYSGEDYAPIVQVTDRMKNVTTFEYHFGGLLKEKLVTENVPFQPEQTRHLQYVYNYNENGDMTHIIGPQLVHSFTYDDKNPNPLFRSNLLEYKQSPLLNPGDNFSRKLKYTYHPDWNQVSTMVSWQGTTDPSQEEKFKTHYLYNDKGLLEKIIQPTITQPDGARLSVITDFIYNSFGQVKKIIDPQGNITNFLYYAPEKPNKGLACSDEVTDGEGGYLRTTIQDAELGLRRQSSSAVQRVKECYFYNTLGGLTEKIDRLGNKWSFDLNAQNQIRRLTGPKGIVATYKYDFDGQIKSILEKTDGQGNSLVGPWRQTKFDYDVLGHLKEAHAEVKEGQFFTKYYRYDNNENLNIIFDSAARVSVQFYTSRGLPNVSRFVNPEIPGSVLHYETQYSSEGKVKKTITGFGGSQKVLQSYDYTPLLQLKKITQINGLVQKRFYDDNFNVERIEEKLGENGDLFREIKLNSNEMGWPTKIEVLAEHPEAGGVAGPSENNSYSNELIYYNSVGLPSVVVNDKAERTSYQYNGLNQVVSQIGPGSDKISYVYNKGLLEKINAQRDGKSETTEFEYNELGKVNKITAANGVAQEMSYNNLGQLIRTDNRGDVTRFEYDGLNRLVKRKKYSLPDGGGAELVFQQEYDDFGRKLTVTDAYGAKTQTTFSRTGQVKQKVLLGNNAKWSFKYNQYGRLKERVDPNGDKLIYEYNNAGQLESKFLNSLAQKIEEYDYEGDRLSKCTSNLNLGKDDRVAVERVYDTMDNLVKETVGSREVKALYNGMSQLRRLTYPSGHKVSYSYHEDGRLKNVGPIAMQYNLNGKKNKKWKFPNGLEILSSFDSQHLLDKIEAKLPTTAKHVWDYDLASADKIDNVKHYVGAPTDPNAWSVNYQYDDQDRLKFAKKSGQALDEKFELNFKYPQKGNIRTLKKGVVGSESVDFVYRPNSVYEYDSISGLNLGYDNNGNMEGLGDFKYQYDALNRLSKVEEVGKDVEYEYFYDCFGRRALKKGPNEDTYFTYYGWQLLSEDRYGKPLQLMDEESVGPIVDPQLGNHEGPEIVPGFNGDFGNANVIGLLPENPDDWAPFDFRQENNFGNGLSYGNYLQILPEGVNPEDLINGDYDSFLIDLEEQYNKEALDYKREGLFRYYRLLELQEESGVGDGAELDLKIIKKPIQLMFDRVLTTEAWADESFIYLGGIDYDYELGLDTLVALHKRFNGEDDVRSFYVVRDHQNSSVMLTYEDGRLIEKYHYLPFGEPRVERFLYFVNLPTLPEGKVAVIDQETPNFYRMRFTTPILYTGRYYDEETQSYDYRYRFYRPDHGLFLQRDPLYSVTYKNPYAYVENNPVTYNDPLGLDRVRAGDGVDEEDKASPTPPKIKVFVGEVSPAEQLLRKMDKPIKRPVFCPGLCVSKEVLGTDWVKVAVEETTNLPLKKEKMTPEDHALGLAGTTVEGFFGGSAFELGIGAFLGKIGSWVMTKLAGAAFVGVLAKKIYSAIAKTADEINITPIVSHGGLDKLKHSIGDLRIFARKAGDDKIQLRLEFTTKDIPSGNIDGHVQSLRNIAQVVNNDLMNHLDNELGDELGEDAIFALGDAMNTAVKDFAEKNSSSMARNGQKATTANSTDGFSTAQTYDVLVEISTK